LRFLYVSSKICEHEFLCLPVFVNLTGKHIMGILRGDFYGKRRRLQERRSI